MNASSNQAYVVTSRGLICIADKTTCSLFAVAAVTFNTSLSCKIVFCDFVTGSNVHGNTVA